LSFRSEKFGDHDGIRFWGVYSNCLDAASSGDKFAFVICTTKSFLDAKPSLAEQIQPVVGRNTTIVLVQNGIGGEDPLHMAFPNNTIISCAVWTAARILDGGIIQQYKREGLTMGVDWNPNLAMDVESRRLDELVTILRAGDGICNVKEDIQSERWVKLAWNVCWNSVTTASQLRTNRFLNSSPHALSLAHALMNEVVAVAKAKGITMPNGIVEKHIHDCMIIEGGLSSSMLIDHMEKRPMEIEAILGYPLRSGIELGVPVPSLTALYSIVKALDWKNAHPEEARI